MKNLVIGVDIGGINTVLGLVDRTGEVYARSSFRTAEYLFDDYPAYVEMLVRTLRELCAAMLPGLYCRVSGSVLRMPTIIRAGSSVRSISGSFDPESRIRRKGGGFSRFARRSATLFPGFPSVSPTTPMPPLSGRSLTAMPGECGISSW